MRAFTAAVIGIALSVPATAATLHEYGSLALSPAGDRIAALESDATADSATRPHERIVIRSASTGRILSTIDPCASCSYSALTFGPDGRLAFLERDNGTTRLMLAGAGAPVTVTTI